MFWQEETDLQKGDEARSANTVHRVNALSELDLDSALQRPSRPSAGGQLPSRHDRVQPPRLHTVIIIGGQWHHRGTQSGVQKAHLKDPTLAGLLQDIQRKKKNTAELLPMAVLQA